MSNTLKKVSAASLSLTTAVWLSGMVMIAPAYAATASDIQAQINLLMSQINALQSQLGTTSGTAASSFNFTRSLTVGSKGDDVSALQQVLINAGYLKISAPTGKFGGLTKAALVKYQKANGISPASGFFGAKTRAFVNSLAATTTGGTGTGTTGGTTVPSTDQLSVALDSSTPAAGSFPAGGNRVAFTNVKFTAGSKDATVTAMNVYRGGLASDNDVSNVYLMDGSVVLATNLGLSSGKANFYSAVGLFTVKAGQSRVITIAADQSGSNVRTFSFSVNSATDVTASSQVAGTFPISGNLMSSVVVSNPALATLTITTSTTSGTVNAGQTNFEAARFSLQSGNSAVQVKAIKLTETGTINAAADLANIKLMNGSVQVGATAAALNPDGTIVFDLSSNPLQIASGQTVILSVMVDVMGGVSRNFTFTIQRTYDITAIDMTYNVGATISGTMPSTASQVSVNAGTLVINKNSSSPANYIAAGATNVTLAKFDFRAGGEAVRVTALTYRIGNYTSGAQTSVWNNLKLVDDQGVQIGSTLSSGSTVGTSTDNALTNLNYIIPANVTRTLSIVADVVSTYSGNVVGSIVSGTAQGYTSLSSVTIGSYAGNTLSSASAPFTASLNNTVGAITTVSGAATVKIGSFTLTAGPAEGLNISSLTVQLANSSTVANALQNLVVKYGSTQIGNTQTTLTANGSYTFSGTISVAAGQSAVIDVYADTISGQTISSATTAVSLTAAQGNGASTNVARSATGVTVTGQTVVVNSAGTLTKALSATTIVSQQVAMGTTAVKLGSFKLSADNNEDINVTDVVVSSTQGRPQDIVNLRLMNGTLQVGSTIVSLTGSTTSSMTFTGITGLTVPQNSYAVLDVLADINSFTNGASSTDTISVGLGQVNYQGAASKTTGNTTSTPTNEGATFTIYRTSMTPAANNGYTFTSGLSNSNVIGYFDVTAGSGNDVVVSSVDLILAGSLLQASSSVTLNVYGSDAPTTLLGTVANASTTARTITLNSSTGWTVAKGTKQYLIVKADLGSASNLVTTTGTKTVQVGVNATAWNDGSATGIAINPTITTPIWDNANSITF